MQGRLGTCYLLETISTLSNYGKLLYQIFPCEKINENGIYEICIFHEGIWQKVLVDDYFILCKGDFAFAKPVNNCLYSCLIEKAYAKIKGSFADINGGNLVEAFRALTSFEAFYLSSYELKLHNNIYDFLINKIKEGYIFSCSNNGHAFSLIDIINENNDIIFQIRNPWGSLSDKENILFNEFLIDYPKYKGIREKKENNKGIFFLNKKRFESYFKGGLSICPILLNSNIYEYKLKNISSLLTNKNLFFKLEISHSSKITVRINDINNFKATTKTVNGNNIENNVKIIPNIKTDFLHNLNNLEKYEIYTEIPPSAQLLKIDLSSIPFDIIKNKILTFIIQGSVENLNFLGCYSNEPKINIAPLELNCINYKYGTKTLKSLTKKNNAINALKEDLMINVHPDSEGFFNEKVFSKDVELKLKLEEPKVLDLLICSNTTAGDIKCNEKYISKKGKELILDDDKSDLCNKSCIMVNPSKLYPKLLINENFGFTTKHVFHNHKLSYSKIIKKYNCNFCFKKFDDYNPSFHCKKCHYHLCIECIAINEYNSFFENMKKTKKIIKVFNSRKKIVNCGFHNHDLVKENVYNNKGFLCDLCFKTFNLSEAYHCRKCNFDLCDNCLENSEVNEHTRSQLILNEEISEVILGFKDFKYKILKFLNSVISFKSVPFLDSLFNNIFDIGKSCGFKCPFSL